MSNIEWIGLIPEKVMQCVSCISHQDNYSAKISQGKKKKNKEFYWHTTFKSYILYQAN